METTGISATQGEYKRPDSNNLFKVKGTDHQQLFKTFDELYGLLGEINIKNNKGKIVESMEEDPLLLDVKIRGVDTVASIPIEGLGVYSYKASIETENRKQGDTSSKS